MANENLLTLVDAQNLKLDAQSIEKFVNDPANEPNPGQADGTLTTRLGQVVSNLAKLSQDASQALPLTGGTVSGNFTATGSISTETLFDIGSGQATGGGAAGRISFTGDRMWIAPTDQAGGFDATREFTYNLTQDLWQAEGGFLTTGDMNVEDGVLYIEERAAAAPDRDGFFQIFSRSDTPNVLIGRDDAGNEFQIRGSVFGAEFESAGDTVVAGGLLTLAHGMGQLPKFGQAFIQCTTADAGYAVGDRVFVNDGMSSTAGSSRGISVYTEAGDTTNVYVRFGPGVSIALPTKDGSTITAIDVNDWDFYLRVFA